MDMVPDFVKDLFTGDTKATADNLSTQVTTKQSDWGGFIDPNTPGFGEDGKAQVIHISLNLDGKEIDMNVINVIGVGVKQAVQ